MLFFKRVATHNSSSALKIAVKIAPITTFKNLRLIKRNLNYIELLRITKSILFPHYFPLQTRKAETSCPFREAKIITVHVRLFDEITQHKYVLEISADHNIGTPWGKSR